MKANLPHCIVITGLLLILTTHQAKAQNLVTNGTFTNGSTAWNTSCTIEINPENVYGGSSTNMVTEIDVERCINQQVCVLAGTTYTFSFKGTRRIAGATPASVSISVKVTGDNSGTSYVNVNRTYTNTTYVYTTHTYSFTIPSNSIDRKVNVSFQNYNNTNTYGVLVDDIDLQPTNAFSINGSSSPTMNVNAVYSTVNTPSTGLNYNWNFIDHASPLTSTAAAPSVKWSTTGGRDITVALSNGTCTVATLTKLIAVSSVLPVKLTDFKARTDNDNVQLTWTTQQEQNNRYFIIQRSFDGVAFDSVGVVAGTNTAAARNYAFTDKHPFNGNNFYRLKQVDIDNDFEYSPIAKATINAASTTVQLYPNPAHSTLYCNFTVARSGEVVMQVANAAGMIVLQQNSNYNAGSHRAAVTVQSLQRGVYYLKMTAADGQQSVKTFSVQ
jgi:hypothetical protein